MRKPIIFILLISIFSIVLSGCGAEKAAEKTAQPSSVSTEATAAPVEITEALQLKMHAIARDFFEHNSDKFQDSDNAFATYYGGIYPDGEDRFVLLLTDISKASSFESVPDNLRIEKCAYSHRELQNLSVEIETTLDEAREQEGFAKDFLKIDGNIRKNSLVITVFELSDEKIEWFRKSICDKPCVLFENKDYIPGGIDLSFVWSYD